MGEVRELRPAVNPVGIIAAARIARGGFLTEGDLRALSGHPVARLWPVLVRCGAGRLSCPVQDAGHFVAIIGREGSDYVRDVSLIAGQDYRV